jgi:hypothetical protein
MADDETCKILFEHGMERLAEKCMGDESVSGKEFAQGLTGTRGIEPDEDCDACLEEGLNEETCDSFKGARQWVFCRVWNAPPDDEDAQSLLELNDNDFEAAVEQAWEMVDAECGE